MHELAITRSDGKVAVFTVNESTGALSPVTGSPFTVEGKNEGTSPLTLAFNPVLQLVAVAETNEHFVPVYEINRTTGAWKYFTAEEGDFPTSVSWSVGGGLLAVANGLDNSVRILRLESSSLFDTTNIAASDPSAVAFSPAGKGTGASTLAIANQGGDSVTMVNVNEASGEAFPVSGSPFSAGSAPSSLAFSASGSLLAVANEAGDDVSLFSVDAETDALSQVPESPFSAGSAPVQAAFSPTGTLGLLAVAHASEKDVTVFTSAHPPTVTAVAPATGPTTGGTSVTITGSNFDGASAVKFGSLNATSYTVNSATSITAISPAATATGKVGVTVTSPGGSVAGGTSASTEYDVFKYEPPGPPELGDCVQVAAGTGEYENAGCTKAKAGSLYDWKPFVLIEGIADEYEPFVLETQAKAKLECRGLLTLYFEPPKAVGDGGISFQSCTTGAAACTVSFNTELEGFLMAERGLAGKRPKIAMELSVLDHKGGLLWGFDCGGVSTQVRGSVLVPMPSTDEMLTTLSPSWVARKGKQKPEKVRGGAPEVLEMSTNGGPWQKAGLTFHPLLYLSEPMEINATL